MLTRPAFKNLSEVDTNDEEEQTSMRRGGPQPLLVQNSWVIEVTRVYFPESLRNFRGETEKTYKSFMTDYD